MTIAFESAVVGLFAAIALAAAVGGCGSVAATPNFDAGGSGEAGEAGGSGEAGAAGSAAGGGDAGSGGAGSGGAGSMPVAGGNGGDGAGGAAAPGGGGGSAAMLPAGGSGDGGSTDQGLEPVRVVRGRAGDAFHELTVVGAGLTSWNGKVVTLRIGHPDRPPERLGSGQARIAEGAFSLSFAAVLEDGLYKRKAVFVDLDGDGSCGPSDSVFVNSAAARAPLMINLSPESAWLTGECSNVVSPWPSD